MRKLVFILLLLILYSFTPPVTRPVPISCELSPMECVHTPTPTQVRENIIGHAMECLGIPYKWGGSTTRSFDCSGFTQWVYSQVGIEIPRTSVQQCLASGHVQRDSLAKGDLVFFSRNRKTSGVYHVGIVIDDDSADVKFIHATRGGVRVTPLKKYDRVFLCGGRWV